MSAYRVPLVVAALAVIALGVPCKDGAAHGDTCGTVVDVDGTGSGELYLLQKNMKLAEVAPHEGAKFIGGDVKLAAALSQKWAKFTGGDVKFAALSQTLRENSARGRNAGLTQAGKLSARGSSDTAALKPSEGATEGQGADAATGEGATAASEPSKGATEGGADAATGEGAAAAPEASKGATEGGADSVADKGDAAEVASADGASSAASTTPKVEWVTPPKDAANATKANGSEWVTPPTKAAAQSQTLPLGCIIWALVIATAQCRS